MHLTARKYASFLVSKAFDYYYAALQTTDRQTHLQGVQKNCAYIIIYVIFLFCTRIGGSVVHLRGADCAVGMYRTFDDSKDILLSR